MIRVIRALKICFIIFFSYLCTRQTKIVTKLWTITRRIVTSVRPEDGKTANPLAAKSF